MKLLVAIDGSEASLHATRRALALLKQSRDAGALTLLAVHDAAALGHAAKFVGRQAVDDWIRDRGHEDMAGALALCRTEGVEPACEVRSGHIAEEITRAADTGGYDFVLLGSKGHSTLGGLLLGSVAQRVAAMAKTPVVLVR